MQGYTDGERRMFDEWFGGVPGEAADHRRALGIPDLEAGPSALLELATGEDGRLPSHGRHYNEGIHLEPSPWYQGEFVLCFDDAGNGSMRVNLGIGDLAALRAALPGRQGATPAEVGDFLRGLHGSCEKNPGPGGDAHEAHKNLTAIVRVIAMLGEA
jgi:hypothetical protein